MLGDVGNLLVTLNSPNCNTRAAQYAPDQAETDPSGARHGAMDGNVTSAGTGFGRKREAPVTVWIDFKTPRGIAYSASAVKSMLKASLP